VERAWVSELALESVLALALELGSVLGSVLVLVSLELQSGAVLE
jgi:hypothetical protein